MIVEERIYTLYPGQANAYLTLYEAEGMAIQGKYLKKMLGYYSTEVGQLNQIVHLWMHDNYEERLSNRQAMRSDPDWQSYWHKVQALIHKQENKFLTPAPFFEARLNKINSSLYP